MDSNDTYNRRRQTFERDCRLNRRSLDAQARNLTGNATEAEDLVQATLARAWNLYDHYDEGRPFRNWLGIIMKSTFLDRLRATGRRLRWSSFEDLVHPDGEHPIEIATDHKLGTEDAVSEHLQKDVLYAAIRRLPTSQRRAIYFCDLLGYDYHECAEREGVPLGTIRSRVSRARVRLRSWLWDWFNPSATVG